MTSVSPHPSSPLLDSQSKLPKSVPAPSSRDRLLKAARAALARRGLHAMSINDLLAAADVAKGAMYHHFPGGKNQLAEQALLGLGQQAAANIRQLGSSSNDFVANIRTWFDHSCSRLKTSQFDLGCPLAISALEVGADNPELRSALKQAFNQMREALEQALVAQGLDSDASCNWAYLLISTFEGALLQAHVHQSIEPVTRSLTPLLSLLSKDLSDAHSRQGTT
jgi:TetR/AcrR family transcriptional regulator, lmrAB and yxaGH operons repressor